MENLSNWIMNELPYNGEWWSSGYELFIKSAEKMLNAGMSEEEIKDILRDCSTAMCGEFGS